jgi:SAM-dependent methyltransferase
VGAGKLLEPYSAAMSFEVDADAYDRYMGHWSSQLAPLLADLAMIRAGQRALDVGCGPGALTGVLTTRLGAGAVSAVDPSESFVAAARARYPGVNVRRASAEQLPFENDGFDAALAGLVVHFMSDPVVGLSEMARVTRPGGTIAASVWDFAGGRGPLGPFWYVARELDPAAEDESRLAGTRQGHLAELLLAAGLRDVDETSIAADREYAGFDDWWQPFTRGVGPGGAYVAGLHAEQRAKLRDRCRSRLPDGPFVLTAHAWAARGTA